MIESDDFARAARAIDQSHFPRTAGRSIAPAMRQAVNLVRQRARAELRPHRKSGRMAGRIRVRVKGSGLATVASVKATGAGSNLIVGGVKPHRITGRSGGVMPLYGGKGKALTTRGGLAIEGFARAVEHPGFPADPFFHRAIEGSSDDINRLLDAAGKQIAKDLATAMEGH